MSRRAPAGRGDLPGPAGLVDLVELVRAPAALSVPGDVLSGTVAAGAPPTPRTAALAASSVCLYWAGMALNDYADRELDAVERPERPIPSGRVRPGTALAVAAGLTGTALALAGAAGGRRALRFAVPLTATVWAYDLALKATPAGPAAMAACRALDVMLGSSTGRPRAAVPAALAIGAHTYGITMMSRDEVGGTTRRRIGRAAAAGAPAPLVVVGQLLTTRPRDVAAGSIAAGLLGGYLASVGGTQLAAARRPDAARVRRAVGAGILGMIPLQAALTAARGRPAAALALAAAYPVARRLARKVSAT